MDVHNLLKEKREAILGLLMDLRHLLGQNVDVVTERGLKPRIRERVLNEAVTL